VADADMRHAVAHHLHELELDGDTPWRVLYSTWGPIVPETCLKLSLSSETTAVSWPSMP
jgi:hypothetical protein